MSSAAFVPHVVVHHKRKTPQPILPVGTYGFFLRISLPDYIATLTVAEQLKAIRAATATRRAYPFDGPFGRIILFEARLTPSLSIYANKDCLFADDIYPTPTVFPEPMSRIASKRTSTGQLYVIGRRADEFCTLIPAVPGDEANDQNLSTARTFTSLPDAIDAATDVGVNVFEVIRQGRKTRLRQLCVDLLWIKSMPFDGCYELMDALIAGPSLISDTPRGTEGRFTRITNVGVSCLISLVSQDELFWQRGQTEQLFDENLFSQHFFPMTNGGLPSSDLVKVILDTLDDCIKRHQTVYLHCLSGRGRTGLIAGCFAARHGVAKGQGVLNWLAERRYQFGLFKRSPETPEQEDFVRQWPEGG